jgi:hypothetical protein
MDTPIRDNTDIIASIQPLLAAAIVPKKTPTKDTINMAVRINRNVAGILLNMRLDTDSDLK